MSDQWSADESARIAKLDPNRIPVHIAIIMDGNGRWAQQLDMPRESGHFRGAHVVSTIARSCSRLGIGYLTLYAFSEENWSRPSAEISALMELLVQFLELERDAMMENGIRLQTIGNRQRLPKSACARLDETIAYTSKNSGMVLTLALSYSGRDEIVRAIQHLMNSDIDSTAVTCDTFGEYLDTASYPDPDLLIRTSGECRISNFLLWQLAYTEMVITPVLWPAFTTCDLLHSIAEYQKRERRYGGIGPQQEATP